jgi:hypothetical protein
MLLWPDAALVFYADSRTTVRSPGTRATWAFAYRGLQRVHPGRHLAGFTPDHLVAFLNRAHDPGGRGWAPGTVRSYRAALRSLFSWAYWAGHVAVDPTVRRAGLCGAYVVRGVRRDRAAGGADRAGPAEICRRVGPGEQSVARAARAFGVSWHAAMAAVRDHGRPRVDHLARLGAPRAVGLDETYSWPPPPGTPRCW